MFISRKRLNRIQKRIEDNEVQFNLFRKDMIRTNSAVVKRFIEIDKLQEPNLILNKEDSKILRRMLDYEKELILEEEGKEWFE